MSQVNLDLTGIARGKPRIPEPIADALTALQTGHNETDTKLINTTSGHNHDGSNSRALTATELSAVLPWMIEINPLLAPPTVVGTWSISVVDACLNNGFAGFEDLNDSAIWPIVLSAGTWRLDVVGSQNTDRGITSIYIDGGDPVGTFDQNGALDPDHIWSVTGIVVATSGKKAFQFSCNTKTGTDYVTRYSLIRLTRTA